MPGKISISSYTYSIVFNSLSNLHQVIFALLRPIILFNRLIILLFCNWLSVPFPGLYIYIEKNFITTFTYQTKTFSSYASTTGRNSSTNAKRYTIAVFQKNHSIFRINTIHPDSSIQIPPEIYHSFFRGSNMHKKNIIYSTNPGSTGKFYSILIGIGYN